MSDRKRKHEICARTETPRRPNSKYSASNKIGQEFIRCHTKYHIVHLYITYTSHYKCWNGLELSMNLIVKCSTQRISGMAILSRKYISIVVYKTHEKFLHYKLALDCSLRQIDYYFFVGRCWPVGYIQLDLLVLEAIEKFLSRHVLCLRTACVLNFWRQKMYV